MEVEMLTASSAKHTAGPLQEPFFHSAQPWGEMMMNVMWKKVNCAYLEEDVALVFLLAYVSRLCRAIYLLYLGHLKLQTGLK